MISLEKDGILYFMHIPKTGGTTLASELENNFHQDSILYEYHYFELIRKIPLDFTKYRLIRGHFGYRLHQLLPKKPIFITLLRDPITRTLSEFNYQKRKALTNEIEPECKRIDYRDKTIDEALSHPSESEYYVDTQVRYLANDVITELSSNKDEATHYDFIHEGRSEQEQLSIAKKRLKEFAFIGVLERYQESLLLLAYTFGWTPPKNVGARRQAQENEPKLKDLSKSTINKIQEMTRLDRQLYEFGLQIFQERYSKMVEELKAKYYRSAFDSLSEFDAVYEMLQLRYSEIYERNYPIKIDTIHEDFRGVLHGWGWEPRHTAPNGMIVRWSGPDKRAIIDLPLKRDRDLKIALRVGFLTDETLKTVKLKVNEDANMVPLVIERKPEDVKNATLKGIIPHGFLQGKYSFIRLIFEVEKMIAPNSLDPQSIDTRPLGIALVTMDIYPR